MAGASSFNAINPSLNQNKAEEITPKKAQKNIGVGYSRVYAQLSAMLDEPVRNNDKYRRYYRQMVEEDETIGTAMQYFITRILSKIGEYTHPNPEVKDYVDKCIEKMRGDINTPRAQLLTDAFSYGYNCAEMTVQSIDARWYLSSLPVYDPLTINYTLGTAADNTQIITEVRQEILGDKYDIPVEKTLIWQYGNQNTPYGLPLLKRCFRWWSFKRSLPKLWAVALDRYGTPILHGGSDDEEERENLDRAFTDMNSKSHVVTSKEAIVQAIGALSTNISEAFQMADAYCDLKIYRSMFMPPLLVNGQTGGSYALGEVQMALFNEMCVTLAKQYIEEELEQLWRRLLQWNFTDAQLQDTFGTFNVTAVLTAAEKEALTRLFVNLSNMGMLDPVTDRNIIRDLMGLPPLDESVVTARWQEDITAGINPPEPQGSETPDGKKSTAQPQPTPGKQGGSSGN